MLNSVTSYYWLLVLLLLFPCHMSLSQVIDADFERIEIPRHLRLYDLVETQCGTILGYNSGQIYRFRSDLQTYDSLFETPKTVIRMMHFDRLRNELFISTDSCLLSSLDCGESWSEIDLRDKGLDSPTSMRVMQDGTLVLARLNKGIHFSNDRVNWKKVCFDQFHEIQAIDVNSSGDLFVNGISSPVLYKYDHIQDSCIMTDTWLKEDCEIVPIPEYLHFVTDDHIIAYLEFGDAMESRDGGETWECFTYGDQVLYFKDVQELGGSLQLAAFNSTIPDVNLGFSRNQFREMIRLRSPVVGDSPKSVLLDSDFRIWVSGTIGNIGNLARSTTTFHDVVDVEVESTIRFPLKNATVDEESINRYLEYLEDLELFDFQGRQIPISSDSEVVRTLQNMPSGLYFITAYDHFGNAVVLRYHNL